MTDLNTSYHYAGFGVRLLASLIDSVLLGILILPLMIHFFGWGYLLPPQLLEIFPLGTQAQLPLSNSLDFIVSYLLPAAVIIIFWIYRSATPGKMVLSLQIIDATTGVIPSSWQCLIRYVGYYISLLPFGLGFWWIIWDRRKQGWHDKLAHTIVIIKRK